MVKKLLGTPAVSNTDLSKKVGVPQPTLSKWLVHSRNVAASMVTPPDIKTPMRSFILCSLLVATAVQAKTPPAIESATTRFLELIHAGEPEAAAALIDDSAIVDRAIEGIELPPDFVKGMRKGYAGSVKGFVGGLSSEVEKGGGFNFLRMRERGGKSFALYRVTPVDGGVNYLEVEWQERGGSVRAVDLEPVATGEPMSASLRRAAANFAAQINQSFLDRLKGKEKAYLKSLTEGHRFVKANEEGQFVQAMKLYAALSPELQRDKLMLVHRTLAAQNVSEEEYVKAIEALIKHHPGDPAALIASVDLWFLKKEFKKVIAVLDQLDAKVGGDPYLEVLRATSWIGLEKPEEAKKVLSRGVAREPTLSDVWSALLDISITEGTHAETARLLDASAKAASLDWSGVRESEPFAAFRASKEGKAWLARLPKEPAEPVRTDAQPGH